MHTRRHSLSVRSAREGMKGVWVGLVNVGCRVRREINMVWGAVCGRAECRHLHLPGWCQRTQSLLRTNVTESSCFWIMGPKRFLYLLPTLLKRRSGRSLSPSWSESLVFCSLIASWVFTSMTQRIESIAWGHVGLLHEFRTIATIE